VRTLIVEFQPSFVSETVNYDIPDFDYTFGDSGVRRRTSKVKSQPGTPNRHYHYVYAGSKEVKRGDWAVVHNDTNFGIVQIKRVLVGVDHKVTKHVLMVITQDEFKNYQEMNRQIDDLRGLQQELEYRLEEDKKLEKFRDLATRDPRAREIMDKLSGFFTPTRPALEATATSTSAPVEEETIERSVTREDIESARPAG
jgi:hypothetical protein